MTSITSGSRSRGSRTGSIMLAEGGSQLVRQVFGSTQFWESSLWSAILPHWEGVFVLLEHLQHALTPLVSAVPWNVESKWRTVFTDPAKMIDEDAFVTVFALVAVLLALTVGGYIVISRRLKETPQKVVRVWLTLLLWQASWLCIPCTNTIIGVFSCRETSDGTRVLTDAPAITCWSNRHTPLVLIASAWSVVFVPIALLTNLLLFDKRLLEGSVRAAPSGRVQAAFFVVRWSSAVLFKVLMNYDLLIPALFHTLSSFYMFYRYVLYLPYYKSTMNVMTCGLLLGSALGGVATSVTVLLDVTASSVPLVLFGAALLVGAGVGSAVALGRLVHLQRRTTQYLTSGEAARAVEMSHDNNDDHVPELEDTTRKRFFDFPELVEVCTRFSLEGGGTSSEALFKQKKTLALAGQAEHPNSPEVCICLANIMLAYKDDGMGATLQVKHLSTLELSFDLRYLAVSVERRATQVVHRKSLGAGALDTISFLEFQKQMKVAKRYHLETLWSIKMFWNMLSDDNVNLQEIPTLTSRISGTEAKATAAYEALLVDYPTSKPLLHAYGKFLEMVKRDYDGALQCFSFISEDDEMDEMDPASTNTSSNANNAGALSMLSTISTQESVVAVRKYRATLQARKSHAVHLMRVTLGVSVLLLVGFVTAAFATLEGNIETSTELASHIASSALRGYLIQSASLLSIQGSDLPSLQSRHSLEQYMKELRDVQENLYVDTFSFAREEWTDPYIEIKRKMGKEVVTVKMNEWDGINYFANKCLELASMNATITPLEMSDTIWFIRENLAVYTAVVDTTTARLSDRFVAASSTMLLIYGTLVGSKCLLAVILVVVFRRVLQKFFIERLNTLRIFLSIPKQLVKRIRKDVKVCVDFDEDVGDEQGKVTDPKQTAGGRQFSSLSGVNGGDSDETLMSRMTWQYTAVLAFICLVSAIGLVLGALYTTDDFTVGPELLEASDRRATVRSVHARVVEASVAARAHDFDAVTTLRGEVLALVERIRRAHYLVKFGDGSAMTGSDKRYDKLDSLMYDKCLQEPCVEVVVRGVDCYLFEYCQQVLQYIHLPLHQMADVSQLSSISSMDMEVLGPALGASVDLLLEAHHNDGSFLSILSIAVYMVVLAALLACSAFLFSGMVARLRVESQRTGAMLLMIPPEIIEKVDSIRMFLTSGIAVDETDRISQDLANSQAINLGIMNHSAAEPLVMIESNGLIISFNRAAVALLGYQESEVLNKNITMLMDDAHHRANHNNYLSNYLITDEKKVIGTLREVRVAKKTGEVVPVVLSVDEIILSSKRVYAGVLKDMSKLAEALEKEKEEQKFSDAILETSSTAVVVCDEAGIVVVYNDAARAIFQYEAEEVVQKNVSMLMPPRYGKHHTSYIQTYVRTGVKKVIGTTRNVQGLTKRGQEVDLSLSLTEVVVGKKTSFASFLVDVTSTLDNDKKISRDKVFSEAIVEHLPAGIIVMSTAGAMQRVNPSACAIFGYTEQDMLGHNVRMLMPQRLAAKHDQYLKRYLSTGVPHVIGRATKMEGQRRDGLALHLLLSVSDVYLGNTRFFVGFLQDETQRHELEAQIENERMFDDSVTNTSPAGVLVINESGIVQKINPAALKLLQYEESEVIGGNVSIIMPLRFATKHDSYLHTYLTTGVKRVIGKARILQALRKDGTEVDIQLSVGEVQLGKQTYFTGFLNDLTARTQKEAELKKQRLFSGKIIDTCSTGIIIIDAKGVIERFSLGAEGMFGYKEAEVLELNVKKLMPARFAHEHDAYLQRYGTTRKGSIVGSGGRTVVGMRKGGAEMDIFLTVSSVEVGEDLYYVGFVEDRTEAKQKGEMMVRDEKLNTEVFKTSTSAIVVIDKKGTILRINGATTRILGYTEEELVGKNVSRVMPEKHAYHHDEYLEAYATTGVKRVIGLGPRIVQGQHKSGREVQLELSVGEVRVHERVWFVGVLSDVEECTRARSALSLHSAFAGAVAEACSSGVVVISEQGIIEKVNGALVAMFGYSKDDLLGAKVNVLMPVRIAARHDKFLADARKTGVRNVVDAGGKRFRGKRKDGTEFDILLTVFEQSLDGAVKYVGFIEDISVIVATEARLQTDTALSQAVRDTSTHAIVIIDSAGMVMECNHAACEMFEYQPEDVVGNNVSMLMPLRHAEQHDAHLSTYLATGTPHVIGRTRVVEGLTSGGEEKLLQLSVSQYSVLDELCFLGKFKDVSPSSGGHVPMEGERALQRAVLGAFIAAVITIDAKGVITEFNPAAEGVFGHVRADVLGKNVTMLMPPRIARHHDEYLANYARTKRKRMIGGGRDVQGLRKDGSIVDIHVRVAEAVVGGVSHFLGFVEDRTEEVEARQAAILAENVLAEALRRAEEAVICIDQHGTMIHFNPQAEHLTGYRASAMVGENVRVLMPSSIADRHDAYLARYLEGGPKTVVDSSTTQSLRAKNGSTLSVLLSVSEARVGSDCFFVGTLYKLA